MSNSLARPTNTGLTDLVSTALRIARGSDRAAPVFAVPGSPVPVLAAPVFSVRVVAAPVFSVPVVAGPVLSAPVLSARVFGVRVVVARAAAAPALTLARAPGSVGPPAGAVMRPG
ncbi:hypothetical protein JCM12681A_23850 [Streptomyces mexicanus]